MPINPFDVVDVVRPEIPKQLEKKTKWRFSFEYFGQMKHFGLGAISSSWFVSLLERLKELSSEDIESFSKDYLKYTGLRYHKINWSAKKIPIKKEDIDWVHKDIISNEDEFPFYQFHVSKSLGRVVGFWGPESIFFIVLLDPLHNLQPSKDYNYYIDDTKIGSCELSSVLEDINQAKIFGCENKDCDLKSQINNIPSKLNQGNFIYSVLDDDTLEMAKDYDIKEIIESGVLYLKEEEQKAGK